MHARKRDRSSFFFFFSLYSPPITGISTGRLALPDDLHHLAPLQAQILCDRISGLDAWQLAFLQPIAFQQPALLLRTEQDVLGHELVMGDVDQQILLLKGLDDGGQHDGDDLQGRGRDGCLGDEDAGVEIVLIDVLGKLSHLLDPDGRVGAELDPDGPDRRWRWGRIGRSGDVGVFLYHGDSRAGGK